MTATTAGIGGNNSMFVALEPTYGTYVDPATASAYGMWVPFLTENLVYTENKYYSKQIREQTIDSDVKQSYYHAAGDITMEVDPTFLPFFMAASRHSIDKSGSGPYVYTATPATYGSTYPGGAAFGLSITIDRNGSGFGYGGCIVSQWSFTIQDGVLRVTMSIIGLSEQEPDSLDTTNWIDPVLFGADAHAVFLDSAGASPTFASPATNFNGFTGTLNYNANPENRIVRSRAATFVSYGETEATVETELDFITRDDYDKFVGAEKSAIRLESLNGDTTFATADNAFALTLYNATFDAYEVDTPDIGSLVMAKTTYHGLQQTDGDPFKLECSSPTNIAAIT